MPAPLQSVTVLAPAKLNLSLDVVGLLPGGYHALDMVMQAVDLYEQVILRRSGRLLLRVIHIKTKGEPAGLHFIGHGDHLPPETA